MLGSNSEYNTQKARVDEVLKLGWAEIFQIHLVTGAKYADFTANQQSAVGWYWQN